MLHTLTLEIPEEVYEPLVKTAERIGQTPEALAAECVADAINRLADDPVLQFIGAFDSGVPDLGTRHDYYIGEQLMREMLDGNEEKN